MSNCRLNLYRFVGRGNDTSKIVVSSPTGQVVVTFQGPWDGSCFDLHAENPEAGLTQECGACLESFRYLSFSPSTLALMMTPSPGPGLTSVQLKFRKSNQSQRGDVYVQLRAGDDVTIDRLEYFRKCVNSRSSLPPLLNV